MLELFVMAHGRHPRPPPSGSSDVGRYKRPPRAAINDDLVQKRSSLRFGEILDVVIFRYVITKPTIYSRILLIRRPRD